MVAITRIGAHIKTGDRPQAGTNGHVYLGIGGREFRLESEGPDFGRNTERTYGLGESVSGDTLVIDPEHHNDPRVDYVLISEFLDLFPVYIRFETFGAPPSDWNLESATITVQTHAAVLATYQNLGGSNNLWLGNNFGKYCYLLKQ